MTTVEKRKRESLGNSRRKIREAKKALYRHLRHPMAPSEVEGEDSRIREEYGNVIVDFQFTKIK